MNDLKRELAPIDESAWKEIQDEVRRTLKKYFAARRLVDFDGPHGWQHSAVNVGHVRALHPAPLDQTQANLREVQPLVELRVVFELSRRELDRVSRGADDPDLQPAIDAARRLALAENRSIFHGYEAAGIQGLANGSRHAAVQYDQDFVNFPRAVSEAIELLREAGVAGPYLLALEPDAYNTLAKTAGAGGFPIIRHVQQLVDEPIVWSPGLTGGLILSARGEDFILTVGRDTSIGYLDHDADSVRLYLEESMTFRVVTPEAVAAIAIGR